MTRLEIAALIKGMLISKDLVRDPVVTVELTNGIVTVMGEVAKPGSYAIDRDDMTILDALGSPATSLSMASVRKSNSCAATATARKHTS